MSPDGRWCRSSGCDGTDFHFSRWVGGRRGGGVLGGVGWGGGGTGHFWVFTLFCFASPVFDVCVWIWIWIWIWI